MRNIAEFTGALFMFVGLMIISTSETIFKWDSTIAPSADIYNGIWRVYTDSSGLDTWTEIKCKQLEDETFCGIDSAQQVCGSLQAFGVIGPVFALVLLLVVTNNEYNAVELGPAAMWTEMVCAFVTLFSFV